jgi:ribosomal protein S28E/S33
MVVVVCWLLKDKKTFYTNIGPFSDDVIECVEAEREWHRTSGRRQRAMPKRLASVWSVLNRTGDDNSGRDQCDCQVVDERDHSFQEDKD